MITEEKISQHLLKISKEDWATLFSLLPEIEATKNYGCIKDRINDHASYSFPFWTEAEIVKKFVHTAMNMDLIPVFNWVEWKEGKDMLEKPDFDFSQLDAPTLCKLFTVIVRTDRFLDGYLINCFENGIIVKLLRTLQHKMEA